MMDGIRPISHGEKLKEQLRDDGDRGLRLYKECVSFEASSFEHKMAEHMFSPTGEDLLREEEEIKEFLTANDIYYIICMHEKDEAKMGVPGPVLNYMIKKCGIYPRHIILVNHFSADCTVEMAKKFNVRVIDAEKVITCFTKELSEIMGLPNLRLGKGVALVSGLLALKALQLSKNKKVSWIGWSDSELTLVEDYNFLSYLAYPLIQEKHDYNMCMQAHVGRNNWAVKGLCIALESVIYSPSVDDGVRSFVKDIYNTLVSLVHMLAGERFIKASEMFALPLAHGYVLETGVDFGIAGANVSNGSAIAQVINPNDRLDGSNAVKRRVQVNGGGVAMQEISTEHVEQRMMHMITAAALFLALFGKPAHLWSLQDVHEVNKSFSVMNQFVPIFATDNGPMMTQTKERDRFFPSVDMMIKEKLVDFDRIISVVEKT